MQITRSKKLLCSLAALATAATLLVGCGGGDGGSAKSASSGTPIPVRTEVKTTPLTTFKFGKTEAKVYTIENLDVKKISPYNIVATTKNLYLQGGEKEILEVPVTGEKAGALKKIGKYSGDVRLRAFDDAAMWMETTKKDSYVFYDGKNTVKNIRLPFTTIAYVTVPGTHNILYNMGGPITQMTIADGKAKDQKEIVTKDVMAKAVPDSRYEIRFADKDKIGVIWNEARGSDAVPKMYVVDWNGKLLYTVEGIMEYARDWAITTNYIIHAATEGDIVVYNKDDGKLIAKTKIPGINIFRMATVQGNDVYVYDDMNEKIYRIDF